MVLFGGILSIKTISFLVFCVFLIAGLGYLLGRITIKGVSLGTAGVFIIALLFGAFFYGMDKDGNIIGGLAKQLVVGGKSYISNALKIIETLGLILFVTSVGFIAGPSFFGDLKKNFKSYILLGLMIIVIGGLSCAACIWFDYKVYGRPLEEVSAMLVGLLSGSLTSTPAFSAAKATVIDSARFTADQLEDIVAVGHGIAYLFGVIGVVLFVQLVPKFEKADMDAERQKLSESAPEAPSKLTGNEMLLDPLGFCTFSVVAILGIIVGSFKFGNFSLTTTGGCLILALVFGHFQKIGKVQILPQASTLQVFRELGLMLFLIGAGVAGGASFVKYFEWVYFIYGIIMTLLPMVIGFIFAKYVLKLNLLNNLGSICGGMTSTPALGTLIGTAKTEKVAGAYASTYPIALVAVVIVSQLLIIFFR